MVDHLVLAPMSQRHFNITLRDLTMHSVSALFHNSVTFGCITLFLGNKAQTFGHLSSCFGESHFMVMQTPLYNLPPWRNNSTEGNNIIQLGKRQGTKKRWPRLDMAGSE